MYEHNFLKACWLIVLSVAFVVGDHLVDYNYCKSTQVFEVFLS